MPVVDITCAACGDVFGFTDEEQAFYTERGFSQPRKCKPCRDAAKAQRQSGGGGYGGGAGRSSGGGYGAPRPPRQLYDVTCASCGVATQVPFKPDGRKPVYCRECYQ
jgi:CxxC-x17-CxxC domain-containing protein